MGNNKNGYELAMGKQGLGMNENGERFADVWAENNLVHKATWISTDHTTENQVDHIRA